MITDTKFYVDAENKVVICELKVDMQMHKHPAWLSIYASIWNKKFPNVSYDGEFTIKAKARCNSTDTFDEKKGKMIAESRAKAKMLNIASRVWHEAYKSLSFMADNCLCSSIACSNAEKLEMNHIKELSI